MQAPKFYKKKTLGNILVIKGEWGSPEGPNKCQNWSAAHSSLLSSFRNFLKMYCFWKEIVLDVGRTNQVLSKISNKWRNVEARVTRKSPDSRSDSQAVLQWNLKLWTSMTPNTLNRSRFMFFYFLSGFCTRKTNRNRKCSYYATENSPRIHWNSMDSRWHSSCIF